MVQSAMWRVIHASALHWRWWDGECVVYHTLSGDTHRFNHLAARALSLLAATPMSAEQLTHRLSVAGDGGERNSAEPSSSERSGAAEPAHSLSRTTLDELLVRLRALGLIEPDDAHD